MFPSQKILYVLPGLSLFAYHESIISHLCKSGYSVDLVVLKNRAFQDVKTKFNSFDESIPDNYSIESYFAQFLQLHQEQLTLLKQSKPLLSPRLFSSALRFIRSYLSYCRRFPENNFYRIRWKRYMLKDHPFLLNVPEWIFKLFSNFRFSFSLLYFLDFFLPCKPDVYNLIRKSNPSLVFSSPGNMRYTKEVEFLKAAKHLRIPTAISVLSWDNLTNKGMIHMKPNYLFVWNKFHLDSSRSIHFINPSRSYIVGSPFFDKWVDRKFHLLSRSQLLHKLGLPSDCQYILYMGSSKNILGDESQYINFIASYLRTEYPESPPYVVVRSHGANPQDLSQFNCSNIIIDNSHQGVPFFDNHKSFMSSLLTNSSCSVCLNSSVIIDALIHGVPCATFSVGHHEDTLQRSDHLSQLLDLNAISYFSDLDAICPFIDQSLEDYMLGNSRRSQSLVNSAFEHFVPGFSDATTAASSIENILTTYS